MDGAGNIFIADSRNDRIREILGAPATFSATAGPLTFAAPSGGAVTSSQPLSIAGSVPGLAYTATASAPWIVLSSTAGLVAYEGGGGYVAAKHGEHAIAATLRLELCGEPVRVIEIAQGMVRTDEFAVNRYRGDVERAAAVYAGVSEPLTAEDVADTIAWAVTRPSHVNVDLLVLRPRAQAAQHKVFRE